MLTTLAGRGRASAPITRTHALGLWLIQERQCHCRIANQDGSRANIARLCGAVESADHVDQGEECQVLWRNEVRRGPRSGWKLRQLPDGSTRRRSTPPVAPSPDAPRADRPVAGQAEFGRLCRCVVPQPWRRRSRGSRVCAVLAKFGHISITHQVETARVCAPSQSGPSHRNGRMPHRSRIELGVGRHPTEKADPVAAVPCELLQ